MPKHFVQGLLFVCFLLKGIQVGAEFGELKFKGHLKISVAGGPKPGQRGEGNYCVFPLGQHDPYSLGHSRCYLYAVIFLTHSFSCCHCSTSQFSLPRLTVPSKASITTILSFFL